MELFGGRILSKIPVQPRNYQFATLRLRGRPSRDGCQSALWDCFGGRSFNMAANLSPKTVPQCTLTTISTRSPMEPHSGE